MRNVLVVPLVLLLCGPAVAAERVDHGKTLAPFLDEQTIAAVHVDLSRLDVDSFSRWVTRVTRSDPKEAAEPREALRQLVEGLKKAGARDVYVVLSLADLPDGTPLVVFPVDKETNVKTLKGMVEKPGPLGELQFEEKGNALVGSSGITLKRLKNSKPKPRPEFARGLDAAGDATLQAAAAPTPALRRSLTEVMPALPRQLGGGPTKVLAEGPEWAAVGLDMPPRASLRMTVKATNATTAKALRDRAAKLLDGVSKTAEARETFPGLNKLAELLTPKVEGDQLTLSLKGDELTGLLVPLVRKQHEVTKTARSLNNLQQLVIAMHTYHDAHNHFPAAASTDKQNKRLLSWRVHLLPYLDQEDLYKEFKLDEPWDSEHNKKLIKKMPKVFLSQHAAPRLGRDGKTTYLVPVGLDTISPGTQPTKITDITDGTSLTIMLVEAADERAVVW